MELREPRIEFVHLASVNTTEASAESMGYDVCEENNSTTMKRSEFCAMMAKNFPEYKDMNLDDLS
jgi:hypothetical protein